jgi:peptide/nickel transport system substrate-binding protein
VPTADIFSKYLPEPSVAERGVWDVSFAGWGPDWFGNAALSYFKPLFSGELSFPPNGSNFGFYDNAATNALIDKAVAAKTVDEAALLWHQADEQVMKDAAFYPVSSPQQPNYRAKQVHNAQYVSAIQNFDPTNVWLDPQTNGG